jgi:hypothetical protein
VSRRTNLPVSRCRLKNNQAVYPSTISERGHLSPANSPLSQRLGLAVRGRESVCGFDFSKYPGQQRQRHG